MMKTEKFRLETYRQWCMGVGRKGIYICTRAKRTQRRSGGVCRKCCACGVSGAEYRFAGTRGTKARAGKICAVDSGAGAANGDKTLSKQMEANQFAGEQHWRIFFNAGNGKGAFGKGVVCFADCGYGTADFDDDALGQCNGSATARKRGDFNRFRADAFLAISLLGKRTYAAKLADSDGDSLCGAGYDDGQCGDRDICQKPCSKTDDI